MAVFGYDKYGAPTTYGGQTFAASGYDLSPINIAETGYGDVTLQWHTPDSTVSYSRIRLVRSTTGIPQDENDGANVRETTPAAPSATHADTGLTQGTYYYYAFFVETDVPAYSNTTVYTRGQIAKSVGGTTYVSLVDGNVNNAQTLTAFWTPTPVAKKWVLAGWAIILTSKRFDFTTRLYQGLPPYYRSDEYDWVEPDEEDKNDLVLASYPAAAKFLSIFGLALDGIQTKEENLLAINNPDKTPTWYLAALSEHTGYPLEEAASSRFQRVRVKNAALLAREKGTLLGVQDEITASLGYDATVTVGVNKMLDWDQSDAYNPQFDIWDAAGSYAVNDLVYYGTSIYRAILANRGAAQGPPNGGSNTWWTQASWYQLPSTTLYNNRYGSKAGWITLNPTRDTVEVLTGASSIANGNSNNNTFQGFNTSGGAVTVDIRLADLFYIRAWSNVVQYAVGDLVSNGGITYEAQANNLGVTPSTDPLSWQVFLNSVPATVDPLAIYENAIPVAVSTQYTFSYYIATVTSLAGASADAYIDWYTAAGTFISTSAIGTSSAITGGWTRRTVTATSPSTARYAVPHIRATSVAAAGKFIFKTVQFEQAAAATAYVPPRRVEVLMKPTRTNMYTNPSYEGVTGGTSILRQNLFPNPIANSNVTSWAAYFPTGTAALTQQTGQTGWANSVVTSARVTWSVASTAVGGGVIANHQPGVTATRTYSALIQVRSNKIQRVLMRIDWYDASSTYLSSTLAAAPVVLAAATVATLNVTGAVAPASAARMQVVVEASAGTSGTVWNVGDWLEASNVQFEENNQVLTYVGGDPTAWYFRGDFGPTAYGAADYTYTWAGTAHASVSQMRGPTLSSVGVTGVPIAIQSQSTERFLLGSHSARISWDTGGAATQAAVGSGTLPVTAGEKYTISAFVWVPTGSPDVSLWYNGTLTEENVADEVMTTKDTWIRLSQTVTANSTSIAFGIYLRGVAVKGGDICYVDGFLVEHTDVVGTYFDGSYASQDYAWAGTAHASKSFYYQGLAQKRYRLDDIIRRSVPYGVPWTTRYADV